MNDELKRYLERGLTVKELREALEEYDDDAKVVFKYNFGDYSRTLVVERAESIQNGSVVWSGYHDLPRMVEEYGDERIGEDEELGDDDLAEVVVIS